MNKTQRMLLALIGHNLFDAPLFVESDVDWDDVFKESKLQTVPLVAFNNYRELPLEEATAETVKGYIRKSTASNIFCFRNHTYLHNFMVKNGISYCVLKGVESARYYPDPLLRSMGDVDFYVVPEDFDRALDIFYAEGFERTDTNHSTHAALQKGHMHFEMHFRPIGRPQGDIGRIFDDYWQDICKTSELVSGDFAEYNGPPSFIHGLILLAHFQQHLLVEGVGLRHLCDWAVFANSFSEEAFVSTFEHRLKRVGLWRLAQILSLVAVKYMGMPHRSWMGDDFATAEALLEDILYGGNFGRKDSQRSYEGFFISNHGKDGVKTNRIIQLFKSLNGIIDNYWKGAKRYPILYPIGWVYFTVRYLFRLLLGKRKINLSDAYAKSGRRKDLYKKLNLFEPDM